MKIKEIKAEDLAFAHAQAGMGGVQFSGVKTGRGYWDIPVISVKKDIVKNKISVNNVKQLMKMTGG